MKSSRCAAIADMIQRQRGYRPEIEDHPFDIGYWGRVAGIAMHRLPADDYTEDGWNTADAELAAGI